VIWPTAVALPGVPCRLSGSFAVAERPNPADLNEFINANGLTHSVLAQSQIRSSGRRLVDHPADLANRPHRTYEAAFRVRVLRP
jgi:hypothetical protein